MLVEAEDFTRYDLRGGPADIASPELIVEQCLIAVELSGYRVERKADRSPAPGFSSVIGGALWLSADWDAKPVHLQAKVLTHELIHIRQRERIGSAKYSVSYLRPRNAWIWEVQGYAQGVRTLVRVGRPEGEVMDECERVGKTLWKNYPQVRWFKKSSLLEATRGVLVRAMLFEQGRNISKIFTV
jgi:hypothetical protein